MSQIMFTSSMYIYMYAYVVLILGECLHCSYAPKSFFPDTRVCTSQCITLRASARGKVLSVCPEYVQSLQWKSFNHARNFVNSHVHVVVYAYTYYLG